MVVTDAYCAGFFDGEGTIVFSKRGHTVYLQIRCTDEDILQRFAGKYGGRVARVTPRPCNPKQQFRWQIGRAADVERALNAWLPYFGSRRTLRALQALRYLQGYSLEEGNPPFPEPALIALER